MKSYYKQNQARDYFSTKAILEQSQTLYENLGKLLNINFDNPDSCLKEFAIKNNLDLKDPQVKQELINYQIKYIQKVNKFYEETVQVADEDCDSNCENCKHYNSNPDSEDECSSENNDKKIKNQKKKKKHSEKEITLSKVQSNTSIGRKSTTESKEENSDNHSERIKIKKVLKKNKQKDSEKDKKVNKKTTIHQLFYIIISLVMLGVSLIFLCIYYDISSS